jgi:hypothetical protein
MAMSFNFEQRHKVSISKLQMIVLKLKHVCTADEYETITCQVNAAYSLLEICSCHKRLSDIWDSSESGFLCHNVAYKIKLR